MFSQQWFPDVINAVLSSNFILFSCLLRFKPLRRCLSDIRGNDLINNLAANSLLIISSSSESMSHFTTTSFLIPSTQQNKNSINTCCRKVSSLPTIKMRLRDFIKAAHLVKMWHSHSLTLHLHFNNFFPVLYKSKKDRWLAAVTAYIWSFSLCSRC